MLSGKLTPEQELMQLRRLAAEQAYWLAQKQQWDAKNGCKEHVLQRGRTIYSPGKEKVVNTHEGLPDNWNDGCFSVHCAICDKDFGWYCPVNPKHYCEYDYKKNGENCIHCHVPSERK
jgi:hypothetical protein